MRSSGRSATSGSRLFISIRMAASWCQPLQLSNVPRGALMGVMGWLLHHSTLHVHAAVYVQDLAGDVGGLVAGKKFHGGGNILGLAETLERYVGEQVRFQLVGEDGCHVGLDEAGRYRVDRDVTAGHFLSQRF